MGVLDKIFGTHSQHELKRIAPIVNQIEALEEQMGNLSDEELKNKTLEFKERLANGETLDDLLPEAFAVVREAAFRVLGMRHYKVQLIGGIILHQGRIAEMRTGEGKTLVSTLPAYLNALTGEGVHIVTVNDYLAKRDAMQMGEVHKFLGLTVGIVLNTTPGKERQEAYNCDITYVTNNEVGFDYLRDNMVTNESRLVQRGMKYAIIDEIDSVLIDEARTPLIISGQGNESTWLYEACDEVAKQLERGEVKGEISRFETMLGEEEEETGDFIVEEKEKRVHLTEDGVKKVENFFGLDNLADIENLSVLHNMILALRANNLMFKDQNYIVADNQILIVDEFTGRILPGRRYSDGLHQAIEAKEHVPIKKETRTQATITFQNLFNKYEKKGGMTGTALTEEQEFRDIYGMDVVVIPTNRPVQRIDHNDVVYKTKQEKYQAVVREVCTAHDKGQPVIVGTVTIETSELLSRMLEKEGISHSVLNAKFHEKEAEIVALAGQHGAVTIATNMAGRGTDIKLDDVAKEAGGLKIIGTERHESRRIDNQLRGRAGRQGDPGESRFYLSLEDDLLRLFGSDRMTEMLENMGIEEGEPIEHKMLSSTIEKAQRKIEENNFESRKNVLKYDQVMNEQREIIYEERRRILAGEDMREFIIGMIKEFVEQAVDENFTRGKEPDTDRLRKLNAELLDMVPGMTGAVEEETKDIEQLKSLLKGRAIEAYERKEAEFPSEEYIRDVERQFLMRVIDARWMQHINDMEQLRQAIGLQSYAQRDPVLEYKLQGYQMFDELIRDITQEILYILFNMKVELKKGA